MNNGYKHDSRNCKLVGMLVNGAVLQYIAPQTNPDSQQRSKPALELHSRATSSLGITSPFQQSQHRKQFWKEGRS